MDGCLGAEHARLRGKRCYAGAGAYSDAMHGMALPAVCLPCYEFIMPYGAKKFARFAVNVLS